MSVAVIYELLAPFKISPGENMDQAGVLGKIKEKLADIILEEK